MFPLQIASNPVLFDAGRALYNKFAGMLFACKENDDDHTATEVHEIPGKESWRQKFNFERMLSVIFEETGITVKEFLRCYFRDRDMIAKLRNFVVQHSELDVDDVCNHNYEYHMYSLWGHTMAAYMYAIVVFIKTGIDLRRVALYHDLGKYFCFQYNENGEIHFKKHAEVGATMLENKEMILSSGLPQLTKEEIFLVRHHEKANLRLGSVEEMKTLCDKEKESEELYKKLIFIGLIDRAARARTPKQSEQKDQYAIATIKMSLDAGLDLRTVYYLILK